MNDAGATSRRLEVCGAGEIGGDSAAGLLSPRYDIADGPVE
jgi:hypothetical protein